MLATLLFLCLALSALWGPGLLILIWLAIQYLLLDQRRRRRHHDDVPPR